MDRPRVPQPSDLGFNMWHPRSPGPLKITDSMAGHEFRGHSAVPARPAAMCPRLVDS